MRFSLLFATAMLIACFSHRTAAQALCPDGGTKTDPGNPATPPVSTNGGPVNTFNWYYGNFSGSAGMLYKLKSTADATAYLELPWQQANNINVTRFQGKNDIPANGWELIRRDLGYDDADKELVTSNPFVILYNKYLSTLRVFVTVQKPQTNFQFAGGKIKV